MSWGQRWGMTNLVGPEIANIGKIGCPENGHHHLLVQDRSGIYAKCFRDSGVPKTLSNLWRWSPRQFFHERLIFSRIPNKCIRKSRMFQLFVVRGVHIYRYMYIYLLQIWEAPETSREASKFIRADLEPILLDKARLSNSLILHSVSLDHLFCALRPNQIRY